ncbi:MAG: cytochrome c-type biogenesis protein [Acidimicrobiales bacterium]
MPDSARRWSWLALAVVLAVALVIGSRGRTGPLTDAQRAHRIATEIRCPTCRGLSAADSDAPSSSAIRDEVLRRVQAGQTDGQIRGYLVSRYGIDILLKPEATGVAGLVWALPVAALVVALGGLALAFRSWRARPGASISPSDQALVDEALRI